MLTSLRQRFPWRPSPLIIAVALSVLLAIWLLSGDKHSARDEPPGEQVKVEESLAQVEVRWSDAQLHPREAVAQGSVMAWQQVDVQAQVSGRVERLLKQQGESVEAGEPLLQLSNEGRTQRLAQMSADVRLRQTELDGAKALKGDHYVSQTELARLQSELARAQAELAAAELAVQYHQPKAPFSGRVDRRYVEVGQHVQPGENLMKVVDVTAVKVTAQIPQQQIGSIAEGQPVLVKLLDGRELQGEVRFVSLAADPATRSFYIEASARNPELLHVAGASATLHIQQSPISAHQVSPALLSLNNSGQMGIHAVDNAGLVVFYPVQVISIDNEGATVAGLPERVQIITQGAGFVRPGQQVQARGAAE